MTTQFKYRIAAVYYDQRDSQVLQGKHAHRMCATSSASMVIETLNPGTLKGYNGDDQQLLKVFEHGDTTSAEAQVAAMKDRGIKAEFRTDLQWAHVDAQLAKGIPVSIGILHHGPANAPTGGGHWLVIVGKTADGKYYLVHDPYGELDLVNGGYPNGKASGKFLLYSVKNLTPRWRVVRNGKPTGGWGIIAQKP